MPRNPRDPNQVVYVYRLLDPRTGEPRYVGQTNNPYMRVMGHMTDARSFARTREMHPDFSGSSKSEWLLNC